MSRSPSGLTVLLVLVGLAASAEAGIVVLDSGDTFVGRIDPVKDVSETTIVVHKPAGEAGSWSIDRKKVRWYDASADAPTDDYWTKFHDAPIDARWWGLRAEFDRRNRPQTGTELLEIPALDPALFAETTVTGPGWELKAPRGWRASVLEADAHVVTIVGQAGPNGYAPRIHVVAAPTAAEAVATPAEAARWVELEVKGLADEGGFAVVQPARAFRGADQELVTSTRKAGREVRAVRRVLVRPQWTIVAAGYADARDWSTVEPLLRRALDTLRLTEDR